MDITKRMQKVRTHLQNIATLLGGSGPFGNAFSDLSSIAKNLSTSQIEKAIKASKAGNSRMALLYKESKIAHLEMEELEKELEEYHKQAVKLEKAEIDRRKNEKKDSRRAA